MLHLSFSLFLCALAARVAVAGSPGAIANPLKPLLVPRNVVGRLVVRQSCSPGYIACPDTGCCAVGDYCATVDGIEGCCPVGTTCTVNSSDCEDPGYLQCSGDTFCCPAGDQCFRDSSGSPGCDSGTGSGPPPATTPRPPPPTTSSRPLPPPVTTSSQVAVTTPVVTQSTTPAAVTVTPSTTRRVTSLADSATTSTIGGGGGGILGGSPRTAEIGAKSFFYAGAVVVLTLCFAWL